MPSFPGSLPNIDETISVGDTDHVAHHVTLADEVNAIAAEVGVGWTAWSPTLTNVTIGNGTVVARYTRVVDTVKARFHITLGSTSSVSGVPTVTLPVNAAANYPDFDAIGTAMLRDVTANVHIGVVRLNSSNRDAVQVAYSLLSSTTIVNGAVNATTPFTWATSDVISGRLVYEAA